MTNLTLTQRQREIVAKAIDYEITALKAQCSYEPDSNDAKGWRKEILELAEARTLIAGSPPPSIHDEGAISPGDAQLR